MEKKDFWKGLIFNASLALLFLSIFYGNLFSVLNQVYFAKDGDGLLMYTNMQYHIKYSESYLRCNSVNFPYGEHVFFTNNQPLISNSIKFLAKHNIDLSQYTIGILNALMIFSILAASILLFMIFFELGVGWLVGALAAVGIAFLSPQLDRFGGHFNLSYVCAIPWFIYIILRFFRKQSWCLSILISITAFIAAITHFYLYGFLALIAIFFYISFIVNDKKNWKTRFIWILHIFIQLILPFIILQGIYFADSVTDRPSYPWGFFVYRAYPQSIFLPLYKPYGEFLRSIVPTNYIDWEGIAFIGSIASAFTLILLWKFLSNLYKKNYNQLLNATPDLRLNILFWTSVAALLYSFGLPFILGLQWLVDYIGPLRQMRGIARFSWIFYYVINIVVFYWLWLNWKNSIKKILPTLLIILSVGILYLDAYTWVRNRGKNLENYLPEMKDEGNQSDYNAWLNHIKVSDFQAILPLPYFHIGSENIWIDGNCDIVKKSLITGIQTGLPSMAVLSSRTSINQTCNNISLILEPSINGLKSMHFPSKKPLLLIAAQCDKLNSNEKRLIQEASLLSSSSGFDYYSLPVNAFEKIYTSYALAAQKEFYSGILVKHVNFYTNDTLNRVIFKTFNDLENKLALLGNGCYQGKAKQYNLIFDSALPLADTSIIYVGSFWVGLFRRDLTPRTDVIIKEIDSNSKEVSVEYSQVFRKISIIDGDWALFEWSFKLHHPNNKIQVTLRNKTLHSQALIVDEFLIRPITTKVYQKDAEGIHKNNRFYLLNEMQ